MTHSILLSFELTERNGHARRVDVVHPQAGRTKLSHPRKDWRRSR
jgi:hypothetical protein